MSDAMVNGLAGAGGGLVAQLLTYPLQTVNTRQQTERRSKKPSSSSSDGSQATIRKSGTILEIYRVIAEEGWGGLYRGLTPSLLGTVASQSVYYYFYQLFRNAAESNARRRRKNGIGDGTVGMSDSLLVAALAGSLNVLLTNPIWVVVTRMQTQTQAEMKSSALQSEIEKPPASREALPADVESQEKQINIVSPATNHGAAYTVQDLYREAGLIGFWKGVLPTLIMVSNPAIQFMIYETLLKELTKKRKINKHGMKDVSPLEVNAIASNIPRLTVNCQIFVIGSIGKLGATIATYPLLVVKSRLQAKQAIGRDKSTQYTGTLDAIFKMIRYEGLTGFYKGMSTKIVQSVAAAALLLMIKEELVKVARKLLLRRQKKLASR
ncbi:peroxisomal nicotinamide adenine dinucleotide carrier isoform X1 [Selaginella moellendorffii]|uniref:peroxisomal nicotinamide adenine dinucleotide carrier isoform X1 n=1 Tax=Selaginella moellendorffii TaxID=88036 RepID=UPI000D1C3AF6|nr:peroxisomal nicotinamide adenine dinucleotide carrier isoform X1 [Selaginella moellendorffii]|eukprot:XP_024526282.1 peroxisomal nicotinamide adenine dinucleotide carrier isoform X1 [Selaginella moellendorffii]